MPIQIIPANPTFSTLLAQTLGQGLGNLGEGFVKRKESQNQQAGISALLEQMGISPEQSAAISKSGLQPKDIIANADKLSNMKKVGEEEKFIEDISSALDSIDNDLIQYSGVPIFSGAKPLIGKIPGTEAFEKRKELDSAGFLVADKFFTHFNKGVINKDKLKKISKDIAPSADLTQRENQARTNAMRRALSLPANISESQLRTEINKAKKETGKDSRPPLESFIR